MLVRAGGRAHAARPSPAAHRSGGRVAAPIPPLPLRCERHARSSCGVAVARGETSGSIDSGINSGIDNSVDRNVSSSNTSTSSSISNAGSTFHNEQQHAQHQHQQHQQHQHQQQHQQQPHHAAATTTTRRRVLQTAAAAVAAAAVAAAAPLAAPRAARAEAAILVGPPESGAKFATISEAIAAAESGATITVLPGRYEERLIIEGKFLTIQSAQAKSVEVVWESQRPYEHTVECKATGGATTLRGLALRHYSKSVAQNYCVLAQAGAVLVMDSCDVRSNSGVGVGVEGAMLQLLDSAVHDCARHGVAAFGGFEGAPGRCFVMGCTIANNRASGVIVRDGGNAVLRENTVTGNADFGVALLDGCTARMFDNKVSGNGAGSVQIDVGSVAVNAAEVASKNALDAPPQALTV